MDKKLFSAPEPEDNDLPASVSVPAAPREDNDLPGESYIDNAAALFNFTGGEDRPEAGPASAPSYVNVPPAAPFGDDGNTDGGETPTPPWLAAGDGGPDDAPPEADAAQPAAPDPSLMPEEAEVKKADRQKLYKTLALVLAAVAVALAGTLTLLLFKFGWLPIGGDPSAVVYEQPQTAAEIAGFYQIAIETAKKNGAGYRKKAWQTVSDMNLTGIALVDGIVSGTLEEYFTPENAAKTEKYEKDTAEAKQNLPAFTLKDTSYIKSAECVRVGNNYQLALVFQHEDTPSGSGSFLAGVTDTVFLWDSRIKPVLDGISQLKAYEDVHVDYTDVTITAEITNTGRIVSMTHTAPAEVSVGSARISIFTFSDRSFHFESTAVYRDFDY